MKKILLILLMLPLFGMAQITTDIINKKCYLSYNLTSKEIVLADTAVIIIQKCTHNSSYKVMQFDEFPAMKVWAKDNNLKATKKEYEYLIK